MSDDIDSILTSVREQGIRLEKREGALLADAPEGALTDSLKSRLADNKEALLSRLASSSLLPALKPQPEQEHYLLSCGQLRMWAMCQDSALSKAYNMSAVFEARGLLDGDLLERAFRYVLGRHESLRTLFAIVAGEPRQFIDADSSFDIVRRDAVDRDSALMEAEAFVSAPFDLASAPLARAMHVPVSEDYSVIAFAAHHIVCDGWSMEIFVKEVLAAYQIFQKGGVPDLPNTKIQYKDFAIWENEILAGDKLADARSYWKETLSGELERLEIPKDRERTDAPNSEGVALRRRLSPGLSQSLRTLSRNSGITQFSLLAALTKALLYRYTGQEDIIVGVPAAGRHLPELGDQIGLFVNTLPFRSQVAGELSFSEFAKAVHGELQRCQEHQGYPFDAMLEDIEYRGEVSRNPLFDVMLVMDEDWAKPALPGIDLSLVDKKAASSKIDFLVHFRERIAGLELRVEYLTDLFDEDRIERMLEHFEVLLASAVADPDVRIQDLDMLPEWEREKLLFEFNFTEAEYPKDRAVHELFEERARAHPEKVALVFGDSEMTYGELDARSNALGRKLREEHGVGPDILVAMLVERSFEMVVGILGILKAGGAYVPIDPTYPADRIRFILEDCAAGVVLHNGDDMAQSLPEGCMPLDLRTNCIYSSDMSRLDPVNSPSDLIYCIYTSGSTGKPKGVLVEHGNVHRLFLATDAWFGFGESDVWTLFHYYGFDFSVWEIFGSLTTGGRLVVVPYCVSRSSSEFYNLLRAEDVTVLSQTPSAFRLLIAEDGVRGAEGRTLSLRYVVFGGEALDFELLRPWMERWGDDSPRLVNMYGITETTVHVTYSRVLLNELFAMHGSCIGVPIPDLTVRILSPSGSLCPIGVPGELCVSGAGVARGYLNRPDLTAERFVEDPFVPGERMYRTGDLARWLPDGNLEFLGRMDQQVKVRGFRVELGEVESVLVSEETVREAAVVARDGSLVAYCVPSGESLDFSAIRASLSSCLPGYMVPSFFVELDSLPLTPNGKLDRKALPEPGGSALSSVAYVVPADELELELCSVVDEVLKLDRVGMSDRFLDLGGDSLKAMRVSMLVRRRLGRDLPMALLLDNAPLSELASALRSASSSAYASIEPAEPADAYQLSSGQLRLWLLEEGGVAEGAYNMGGALEISGELDASAMRRGFELLLERHEILRTAIVLVGGEPRQCVLQEWELDWAEEDASGLPEEALRSRCSEFLSRGFDLSSGSMLRAVLLTIGEGRHALCVSIHHIAGDGWSTGLVVKEVMSSYDALASGSVPDFEPLRIQYKDYASWQSRLLSDGALEESRAYWTGRLSGLEPLDLPADRPRPAASSFNGASIARTIPLDTLSRLRSLCSESDATLFPGLVAVLNALLHRYTGQGKIAIGTPTLGRPVDELRGQVGFYVNTLVLAAEVEGSVSFSNLLASCRSAILEAVEHEGYPFERIVSDLGTRSDASRNPVFDVMAVMDPGWTDFSSESLGVAPLSSDRVTAKFDLSFGFSESEEGLRIGVEYSTDLFDADRIERMLEHFEVLMCSAVADSDACIQDLDMLPFWESEKLLVEFNDTAADYPKDKLVHELFEKRARERPEKVALVFGDSQMTYGQLDARSNALARTLREDHGVGPDVLVAMLVERSFETVVGILGVLKSGGAYVPIDPEYPEERIRFMLEDCGASTVLSNVRFAEGLLPGGCSALDLREERSYSSDTSPLERVNVPSDLIYCIYTSGSTGRPKGVLLEHGNVVNTLSFLETRYPLGEVDSYLLKTSFTFDVSVSEIFGWFFGEGSLAILEVSGEKKPDAIIDAIERYNVSHVNFVPSMLNAFIDIGKFVGVKRLASLKYVLVAGEAFPPAVANKYLQLGLAARLENIYGPTEGTIYSTWCSLDGRDDPESIPIGTPIENCIAWVLDVAGSLCPIGVPGELCVSGAGVARGYLNRPDLTAERFVEDPFVPGERMYRTGDLARWLPDGNLEFLGRMDQQVKVRGHRVELGEIESVLSRQEGVRTVAVKAWEEEDGDKSLVGYVSGEGLEGEKLRETLRAELPEYMVPGVIIVLEALPLNANSKVDRNMLSRPKGGINQEEYEAPRDEIERKIVETWEEVLGRGGIGVRDNFLELGGHSLSAVKVTYLLQQRFELNIQLSDLMTAPTIATLAKYIRNTNQPNPEEGMLSDFDEII